MVTKRKKELNVLSWELESSPVTLEVLHEEIVEIGTYITFTDKKFFFHQEVCSVFGQQKLGYPVHSAVCTVDIKRPGSQSSLMRGIKQANGNHTTLSSFKARMVNNGSQNCSSQQGVNWWDGGERIYEHIKTTLQHPTTTHPKGMFPLVEGRERGRRLVVEKRISNPGLWIWIGTVFWKLD